MNKGKKERIDLFYYLSQYGRMFKRTWYILIILFMLAISVIYVRLHYFYTPLYRISASFSVEGSNNDYYSNYTTSITLEQLSATFPYILESGALKKIVCEDIGAEVLPGTITASVVDSTNLFQISVTAEDAQTARIILASVIKKYPTVAKYIIGDTSLHILDQEDVPSEPFNKMSFKQELKKYLPAAVLLYGVILSFLMMSNHTICSEEDLKRYVNIRLLASIPKSWIKKRSRQKTSEPLIGETAAPAFVEAFNILCVRILRQLKIRNCKVVLVTSCRENEGKTTVAVNLAMACAQKGYRTLLIDGDFRNPSVLRYLNAEPSLSEKENFSADNLHSENVVFYALKTNLDILGSQHPAFPSRISQMLNETQIHLLLERCRQKYDCIFIDTPPCSMMQDALSFARHSDCTLFVVRQDYAARENILNSLELLSEAGSAIIGYTINLADRSTGSYGSGKYGYGKYGYGKYGYGH